MLPLPALPPPTPPLVAVVAAGVLDAVETWHFVGRRPQAAAAAAAVSLIDTYQYGSARVSVTHRWSRNVTQCGHNDTLAAPKGECTAANHTVDLSLNAARKRAIT